MICVIALIVAGILGIFSAKYRIIAKEAFNCTFRKITFRKCNSDLNTRLKSQITGSFMRFFPKLGRVLYRYFEVFSWFFLIITILTLFFTGQGIYNYALYGNCNGPNNNQFCIFDPLGTNQPQNGSSSKICAIPGMHQNKTLTLPTYQITDVISKGNPDAKVTIIEFGCYACHYTQVAESTIKKIFREYDTEVFYVYIDFPLSTHENEYLTVEAAFCAKDQGKYWEYREYLFANQPKHYYDDLVTYATVVGLNENTFRKCLDSNKYQKLVQSHYQTGLDSGITVTPTFFINNQTIVGAKDYNEFKKIIRKELGYSWWEFWK
ncbi:MAG: DsbA family protein [Candidatus Woesearchaeota archaeon]